MPPDQGAPTPFQDGLTPLYDTTGGDAVVREVGVIGNDANGRPAQFVEGRPPMHAILPVADASGRVRFERVLVLEAGSKIAQAGAHGVPTVAQGRSTIVVSTESPADGSQVSEASTYPVAMAMLNQLLAIVNARLVLQNIGRDGGVYVGYEVVAGRSHSRPWTDALIWALGQKEPGKGAVIPSSVPTSPTEMSVSTISHGPRITLFEVIPATATRNL